MAKATRVGESSFKLVWSRVNLFKWLYNHLRVQAQPALTRFSYLTLIYHFPGGFWDRWTEILVRADREIRTGSSGLVRHWPRTWRGMNSTPSGSLHAIVTIFESRLKLVLETVPWIVHLKNISNRRWNQFVIDILRKIFRHKIVPDIDPFFEWIFTKIYMVCIGRHGYTYLFHRTAVDFRLWFWKVKM